MTASVDPSNVKLPLSSSSPPDPAITTLLSVKSAIAAVSAARVSMFAVPSINKSWNSFALDPRSLDPSSSGKMSPPVSRLPLIVVIPEIETPP